jgi:hypothetical protein
MLSVLAPRPVTRRAMKKSIALLSVLLLGAVVLAAFFAVELQVERERADALALRAFEQEPVEKGTIRQRVEPELRTPPPEWVAPTAPPKIAPPAAEAPPVAKSAVDCPGTLRTRERVNRLQSRLSTGTPLQDYQICALIEALDAVHSDQSTRQSAEEAGLDEQRPNDELIQAVSDILFESQMEVFAEMLREGDRG